MEKKTCSDLIKAGWFLLCCVPAHNKGFFLSSLAVLTACFPLHWPDHDTVPRHRRNTAFALTNERKPMGAVNLLEKCFPWGHSSEFCWELAAKFDGSSHLAILYAGKILHILFHYGCRKFNFREYIFLLQYKFSEMDVDSVKIWELLLCDQ